MNRGKAKSRRERVAAPQIGAGLDSRIAPSCPTIGGEMQANFGGLALADDEIWDVFEPEVFGGPEAEPQPEYGDFFYETDDWERVWI